MPVVDRESRGIEERAAKEVAETQKRKIRAKVEQESEGENTVEFTLNEIQLAIERTRNWKAPGLSGIKGEMVKESREYGERKSWKEQAGVFFWKKRNSQESGRRGISKCTNLE
ncbi:hypothetical protein J6590_074162 [Homalodisca vitripennis]|nr:hypothetical protein J6590_074162 [Homalodisca vitripennis]